MLLNRTQIEAIEKACNEVDYGSVTIKINKESKTFDIVIEKQIRLSKEYTKPSLNVLDKKYK